MPGFGQARESRGTSFTMRFILRYRIPVLIVLLAATALLACQIRHVRLTADPLGSMFPEGHPFLPAFQATERMAPPPHLLIAILEVRDGDIYKPETIRKIDAVTKALLTIEGVLPGGITSLTRGIDHYEHTGEGLVMDPILGRVWPETEEDFQRLRRKVAVNPMGLGRYVSYDGSATMITAQLLEDEDAGLPEPLLGGVEEVRSTQQDSGHRLCFMGPQLIEAQMTSMGQRHIPAAAAASFIILSVLLALYFRWVWGVLLPIIVMAFSLIWTMGLLGASRIGFHPMPLTFPLILGLLSLAYAVMVLEGYGRVYRGNGDRNRAIRQAYRHLPVAGSILTVGLVILSMSVVPVPVFRGLAWQGFFWFIGTTAVVMLALPVLPSLVRPPGSTGPFPRGFSSAAAALSRPLSGKGRRPGLGVLIAVLVLGGICGGRLPVGDNVPGASYIRPGQDWNRCFQRMAEKFMGPYQLLVHARATEEEGLVDPEAMHAIGDFCRYLRKQGGARDCIAFDMMIRMSRNMLVDGHPKAGTLPVSRDEVKRLAEIVLEQGEAAAFMAGTFSEATLSPFFPDEEHARIEGYASTMQAYIDRNPSEKVSFHLGGGLLGMVKMLNDATRQAYGKTLALGLAVVLVLGIAVTGSVRASLAAALPLAAAQALVWTIMAAAGIGINLPVALVSATALGFGSLFGQWLAHPMGPAPGGSNLDDTENQGALATAGGGMLFLGVLLFCAAVPWFFIGLRFPGQMVLVFGATVLLCSALAPLLVPPFNRPGRA